MFINNIKEIPKCMCGKQVQFRRWSKGFYVTCLSERCVVEAKLNNITEESKSNRNKLISDALKNQHKEGRRIESYGKISEALKNSEFAKLQRHERSKKGNKALNDMISKMNEEDREYYFKTQHASFIASMREVHGVDNPMHVKEFVDKMKQTMKSKDNNGESILDKTHKNMVEKGRWAPKESKSDFKYYRNKVQNETIRNIKKHSPEMLELRSNDLHIDHMYSISEGFKNNIPPYIVGNINNLRLLEARENIKKGSKCDISIDLLYEKLSIGG